MDNTNTDNIDMEQVLSTSIKSTEADLETIKSAVKEYNKSGNEVPESLKIAAVKCNEKLQNFKQYQSNYNKSLTESVIARYK